MPLTPRFSGRDGAADTGRRNGTGWVPAPAPAQRLGLDAVPTGAGARERLNTEQRTAVEHTEGPLLILAGAGSGKTRVVTMRIARLIEEQGVAPWNIMAVTFTNKAAAEMRERVAHLVGEPRARYVAMGTFHRLCVQILRRHAERLGFPSSFAIYDDADQQSLVKQVMKELNLPVDRAEPRAILGEIDRHKNAMRGAGHPAVAAAAGQSPFHKLVADVYPAYDAGLKRRGAMDFNDLILNVLRLFDAAPDVLADYRARWRYVHVDEYQDTNPAQYEFLWRLTRDHRNVCVVGDDDQSIYSWRGADVRILLNFERHFPGATLVKLERNYRSTGHILECAHAVVEKVEGRKGKKLWTDAGDGDPVMTAELPDSRAEADFVTNEVERLKRTDGMRNGDFAVFFRTGAQSRLLEDALRRRRIPYTLIGGVRFYERKEIKDILAYLKVVANPADEVSLLRALGAPKRGIGEVTIERLREAARLNGTSVFEAMRASARAVGARGTGDKLGGFAALIDALRAAAEDGLPLGQLVERTIEGSGYKAALGEDDDVEAEARRQNLGELVNDAAEFERRNPDAGDAEPSGADADAGDDGSTFAELKLRLAGATVPGAPGMGRLIAFLEQVGLQSDQDTIPDEEGGGEPLLLMTLHAAKGLEFPVVFMTGMEEGLFPHIRSIQDTGAAGLDEERRLCYVGMTRARRRLYMTHVRMRQVFGRDERAVVSRFVKELPEERVRDVTVRVDPRAPARGLPVTESTWGLGRPSAPTWAPPLKTAAFLRSERAQAPDEPRRERDPDYVEPGDGDVGEPASAAGGTIAKGTVVQHREYGRGRVVAVQGTGRDARVSVLFPGRPMVKVIARFLSPVA